MPETVSEIARLWNASLARIEAKLHENHEQRIFDSFFAHSYVETIEGKTLLVVVNSGLAAVVLESTYKELILSSIQEATGTDFQVRFITEDQVSHGAAPKKEEGPTFFADDRLDPKYTFDNFVTGASNREAYQASLMIARNPGKLYNPLFIYSNSGLGKTHLLYAIGNAIKERSPTTKVLYTPAIHFIDEYVKFAQGYNEDLSLLQFFKNEVEVLLIDDIQILAGKKKTMDYFFQVFQTLYTSGKQIVITSDQQPGNLDGFDERLKTRFSQGLPISINPPDLATSEAILRAKIEACGLEDGVFDDDVIQFLASRFSSNIRELEGALNRLIFSTIQAQQSSHITMDATLTALSGMIDAREAKTKLSEERVIAVVADYYSFTPSQLTGKNRTAQVAMARHIAMYLIRTLLDTPYAKIGSALGGRDHATVMTGIKKVESELKTNPSMRKAVDALTAKLK